MNGGWITNRVNKTNGYILTSYNNNDISKNTRNTKINQIDDYDVTWHNNDNDNNSSSHNNDKQNNNLDNYRNQKVIK